MELREQLMTLLRARQDLTHSDLLSLSVAISGQTRTEAMIAFLENNPDATVDEVFQKAGEIAFGKNA